jgi:transposase
MRFEMPEDTLPEDHRARLLWQVVEKLDLSAFTADAKAREGVQGRPVTSVRMLLTLWLYAISVGIGSAREVARLTTSEDAFRWIVGDQRVSHDTLASFRIDHGPALDKLFTDVLAVLVHRGLVSLDLVAQDGTRVRASASAPSFRREASLEECREQAALHLKAVLAEQPDGEASAAEKRARLAAARAYQQRVDEAIATVREMQADTTRKKAAAEPRASTTDAEARNMKMANGGFRPGYNVQMATAGSPLGGPRTIVGVHVTNKGSDMGSIAPMLAQIHARTGKLPKTVLADANHANHSCIRRCAELGVEAIIPVPSRSQNPGAKGDDDAAVVAWRARMNTKEAKEKYRARASLCELPNAHLKQHQGIRQALVRGLGKVTCLAMLAALSANLVQHAARLLA